MKVIASMLRFFGAPQRRLVQARDMKPFAPIFPLEAEYANLFANQFTEGAETLFLIVNRAEQDMRNVTVVFNNTWHSNAAMLNVYDCFHGTALSQASSAQNTTVYMDIQGLEYSAL